MTEPTKRPKNPEYAVLMQVKSAERVAAEAEGIKGSGPYPETFELLSPQVKASSRREAIKAVSELEGTFLVIPTHSLERITRKTKQTTLDEWL